MIKGPKLRLKAIAPRMAQKTQRELNGEWQLDGRNQVYELISNLPEN